MPTQQRFALIGAAGFVAPRHMKAIKETGHHLVAALDPHDSVGILDSYFPETDFFVEFERFDRHVDKRRRAGPDQAIDYVSVCSPNYLHDSHVRFALRSGADAICEKPLVIKPRNLDGLAEMEEATGRQVNVILQLRRHPSVMALRDKVAAESGATKHDVELTYITSRGRWYGRSWKGDARKSGGIATNIGVHFFDMLHHLFGAPQSHRIHVSETDRAAGFLEFEAARVRWFLSIDENDLPRSATDQGLRTYRSIAIDGEEFEFSGGFTDLHTRSYDHILAGQGYGIEDTRVAIELVSSVNHAGLSAPDQDAHPLVRPQLTPVS